MNHVNRQGAENPSSRARRHPVKKPPMHRFTSFCALAGALAVSACAPSSVPANGQAAHRLKQAASTRLDTMQRARLYLEAAREASGSLDSDPTGQAAAIHNRATADLAILLRSAEGGRLWNRTLNLGPGQRLRFARPARHNGVHDPGNFTSFVRADEVDLKTIKRRNLRDGVGGALVGIRKTDPAVPFSPWVGVTAPVTALLNFKGGDATLSLVDPDARETARIGGKTRVTAADFSAPLAYYPQKSETWEGLMGAIRVDDYMNITGLYMLEPHDPEKIPLIFVHGLISTPRMWRNVINELEADPVLRRRYQFGVFAYPTGNPPLYSALRLREQLAEYHRSYPDAPDCVLVGHSMGGILSRTQVTTIRREDWNVVGTDKADRFFARVPKGSLLQRIAVFEANPRVDRTIFICTPHRGSDMAIGTIGELAIRLIALPVNLTTSFASSVGDSIAVVTGNPDRLPNSITGLSPGNPTFAVLDTRPIETPHHSIIGDRGQGGGPQSTDGVVAYWSSHLKSAASEKFVPGPHGACELPETLDELRRLLHLHLKSR